MLIAPRAPRVRGGRESVETGRVHRVDRVDRVETDVHRVDSDVVVGSVGAVGEERGGVELDARRGGRAAHEHVAGVETPAEGKT